jgi:OmpA-OmpF porin, OOP family
MKKTVLSFLILFMTTFSVAQKTVGGKVAKNAKEKTYKRGEQKGNETVDKALDKVEEGIKGIFKKKDKNKKTDNTENTPNTENENQNTSTNNSPNKPTKSNSKFDFEPGKKQLYFDNFDRLNVGDFPKEFNTNASGEIVTLDEKNGKWLNMTKNGAFVPDNIKNLPENFTLEFEVGINSNPSNNYPGFGLNFSTNESNLMLERFFKKGNAVIYLHPGTMEASVFINPTTGSEVTNDVKMPQWSAGNNNFVKVSLWRQEGRLRVYVNEDKLLDVPRFFAEKKTYDFAFFRSFFKECEVYITNIRFAVAGEDTRNTLLTEGRFVTNGILFDTNSDNIKPESGVVLKEIASVLKENPSVKVKIIGHTDSDGDAKANIILSKKRAEAVKSSLSNFYDIDINRMETDGQGESKPLNQNANATEKAQNRRVEFVKL